MKLTAYALGELDDAERDGDRGADLERRGRPRAEVEEIRDVAQAC